jgi:predicted transcriptional regulator
MFGFNLFNIFEPRVYSFSIDSTEKPLNLFNEDKHTKVRRLTRYVKRFSLPASPFGRKHDQTSLPLHKKYRNHFEIMALVLEAVKTDGATRFPIMRYAGINCTQLKKCLKSLTEMGFIKAEASNGSLSYKATERGLEFLSQYYVLLGMLLAASSRDTSTSQPNKNLAFPVLQRNL